MSAQISLEHFALALEELGHKPDYYRGKKLSLEGMTELYEVSTEEILEAIEQKVLGAHYDYTQDTIWVDALEAAHFYYCIQSESHAA
jgi:hypothetical protein